MSADYWSSSQRTKWQLNRSQLLESRRKVMILERKMIQNGLIKELPQIQYDYNMRIYLHNLLIKLGRRLNIRQVALATGEIYLIRFLTRVSIKEINVYLLVTTCVYVACKVEECPQHIRLILSEARNLWPEYIPQDTAKLAEFEFYLIEEMDLYLFLHHPYRSLIQIKDYLIDNFDTFGFKLTDDELQNSWSLINDSYITDLHLFLPPHIISIAAIYITIVLKKNLAELRGSTDKDENDNGHNSGSTINNNSNNNNNSTNNNSITTTPTINTTNNTNTNTTNNNNINSNNIINNNNNNNNNDNNNNNNNNINNNNNNININNINNNNNDNININKINNNNMNNNTVSNSQSLNNTNDTNSNDNQNSSTVHMSTAAVTNDKDGMHIDDLMTLVNPNSQNKLLQNSLHNQNENEILETNFHDTKLDEETIKINKFMNFLIQSHINLDEVVEAMQDMINLYVIWNRYNEAGVKKALQSMLLAR
jgi:cyclin C